MQWSLSSVRVREVEDVDPAAEAVSVARKRVGRRPVTYREALRR